MYVTRPLSMYKSSPEADSSPPPEGPNSGYLVIADADEENEAEVTFCWGLCKDRAIPDFPFPQNKILSVRHSSTSGQSGEIQNTSSDEVYFIPALDQPLSSNHYYVIHAAGKYKGNACTCSREEDKETLCCWSWPNDVEPRALDHRDVYQQVEVRHRRSRDFVAKSLAPDGIPPKFLRTEGWSLSAKTPKNFNLSEADGIDQSLRARLPPLDLSVSKKLSPSTVVGKWYIPFMFVKEEGVALKDQMEQSVFYQIHLERLWEEIYSRENYGRELGNVVTVNAIVQRESATVFGEEVITNVVDGVMWLRGAAENKGVGLSMAIVDRMKWEACRGGWIDGKERDEKVERMEKFEGGNEWWKLGCYVLVERFVLKRIDGSLVLNYDYRHIHVIRSKWE